MKKIITFVTIMLSVLVLFGCLEVEDIVEIEFVTFPKTIYVQGEEIDHFSIEVITVDGSETLTSDDERLVITGFDTATTGTKTMVITVPELDNASISFVYNVVSSLIDVNFGGGTGTELDPYQIKNPQHLSNVRLDLDAYYELANDIDLTDVQWSPIGRIEVQIIGQTMSMTVIEGFSGQLDGQGFSIINFTITEDGASDFYLQPSALFQAISDGGVVKNLTFESPNLDTGWSACALAGLLENASVDNVHVTDGYFSGRAPGGLFNRVVGNSTVSNVTVEAELVVKMIYATFGGYRTTGGITVQTQNSHPDGEDPEVIVFENVTFTGSIVHPWSDPALDATIGAQGTFAGLIIGRNQSEGDVELRNVSATGTITGNTRTSHSFFGYTYDGSGNLVAVKTSEGVQEGNYGTLTDLQKQLSGSTEYAGGELRIYDDEGTLIVTTANN
jgi:YD repeat-containing protein